MARSRIEIVGEALEHQTDADLAVRAAAGDREAFEELYRRHSRTATRVAYRVTGNIHDAGDAVSDAFARVMQALPEGRLADPTRFRSYLLTATRHAAVDVLRRAGRAIPHEDGGEPAQTTAGPSEMLIDRTDNALVAAAFRNLPERWRSVLWLTEVEGIPAREAAGMLGVSPNGVAQLAVRARAGLRERYLQAHLPDVAGECATTVQRLGAYVGGGLAARDIARVDQHLASCAPCSGRRDELEQIGTTLRKAVLPLPLAVTGLGGVSSGLLPKLWAAAEKVSRSVSSLLHGGADAAATRVAPVGVAAAAVFVASVASVGVVNDRQTAPGQTTAPVAAPPATAARAGAPTSEPAAVAAAAPTTTTAAVAADAPRTRTRAVVTPALPGRTHSAAPSPTTTTTTTKPTTATTAPRPPASSTDRNPIVGVPDLTLPDEPIDLPDEIVPVPELPGLPGVPQLPTVDDVVQVLPMDVVALNALTGAAHFALFTLWVPQFDDPLPSPKAPGLPV